MGCTCRELCVRDIAYLVTYITLRTHVLCSLPPSSDGEWWELRDENRGGTPYYYHTKSGDTTWEKPDGFVIPLGVIQVRARWAYYVDTLLNKDVSRTRRWVVDCLSQLVSAETQSTPHTTSTPSRSHSAHASSTPSHSHSAHTSSTPSHSHSAHASPSSATRPSRRVTAHASPPSIISEHTEDASGSIVEKTTKHDRTDDETRRSAGSHSSRASPHGSRGSPSAPRTRSTSNSRRSPATGPQSLTAAVEYIAGSGSPKAANGETASAPEGAQRDEMAQHADEHTHSDKSHSSHGHQEKRSSSRSSQRRRMSSTVPKASRSDGGGVPSTPITKVYSPNSPLRNHSSTNVAISPQQLNSKASVQPIQTNGIYAGSNVLQKSPRRPIPAVPSSSSETAGFWRPRRNTAVGGAVNIGRPVLDVGKYLKY
jgi:Rho GTPase-activating protein 39